MTGRHDFIENSDPHIIALIPAAHAETPSFTGVRLVIRDGPYEPHHHYYTHQLVRKEARTRLLIPRLLIRELAMLPGATVISCKPQGTSRRPAVASGKHMKDRPPRQNSQALRFLYYSRHYERL
ncbi:hypothetical protein AVEN_134075-1 [Araneus ventricosus]|uniref:Uncharacterized protein n=1 Tax=Araneus ventricosus TaxID=182803 RepID=A0A4Y2INQ6_ARAVE|nr:hypothetical protein AVEN_134075-1 [Araneus ventricosus]